MLIPFWNMTTIIFLHTSTLEAKGTTTLRTVRTNSSVTRYHTPEELHHSPTTIQLHHFTIKWTSIPKKGHQFFHYYFITRLQPYKRMTSQDGEYISSGNSSHVPSVYTPKHVFKVGKKTKQKTVHTAMPLITITCKVLVRRANTTSTCR
jgi:hypothetical protein